VSDPHGRRPDPYGRRPTPYRGRPLASGARPVAYRRHAPEVYRRRQLVALILAVLVLFLGLFVVDRLVRFVLPAKTHHVATDKDRVRTHHVTAPPKAGNRTPVTAPVGHNDVMLSAVGDTELGTAGDLPPDPATYLDPVKSALAAPIVFGNLEGTLTTATSGSKCPPGSTDCYAFEDPPSYAGYLKADGFNVLNSANNHSHDFGTQGVTDTSAALKAAGIVQAGLPGQIGVIRDDSTKVAFADFAPYPTTNNLLDAAAAKKLIARARTLAPVVVVYMHAGAEGATADHVTGADETYVGENRGNPEAFAKAAIDDGASAVIASGPHVLRGMEFYKGHLIAYSLGDFAAYNNLATNGTLDLSGILHETLSPSGAFVRASWISLLLNSTGQPSVDTAGHAAVFVNQLSTEDFGSAAALIQGDGTIVPAATSSTSTSTGTAGSATSPSTAAASATGG
jgi:hypothetical protein